MPFGEFQYSVDDKGRVIVPPSFRDFVTDGMIVTRGMEGCLYVFPLTKWNAIESELSHLSITDAKSRGFVRFFYSGASKAKIDSAGRITIPATLRSFASLENNVRIAGFPNRLEIWDEAKWEENINAVQNQPDAPEALLELVG